MGRRRGDQSIAAFADGTERLRFNDYVWRQIDGNKMPVGEQTLNPSAESGIALDDSTPVCVPDFDEHEHRNVDHRLAALVGVKERGAAPSAVDRRAAAAAARRAPEPGASRGASATARRRRRTAGGDAEGIAR